MKKLLVLSAFIAISAFAAEYLIDYQVAANEVVSGRVHNQQVTLRPNGRLVICRLREIRNDEKGYVIDNFPGEDPYHNPDMVKVMDIDGVGKLYIFYRDIDVRPVYRVVENRVVKLVPRKQLLQSEIPRALRYVGPKPSGPFQIQHPDERSPQTIVLPPEPKPAETAKEDPMHWRIKRQKIFFESFTGRSRSAAVSITAHSVFPAARSSSPARRV